MSATAISGATQDTLVDSNVASNDQEHISESKASPHLDTLRNILAGRVYSIHTDTYPALGNLVEQSPDRKMSRSVETCFVAFSASCEGVMFVDGRPVDRVYWDEGLDAVGWTAKSCKFVEGRLTFGLGHQDIVGTVHTADGDVLAALGEYQPILAVGTVVGGAAAAAAAAMEDETSQAAAQGPVHDTPTASTVELKDVEGETFETWRRVEGASKWTPWCSLFLGTEVNDVLSPVVFYGLEDVSSSSVFPPNAMGQRLVKQPRMNAVTDADSVKFDITFTGVEDRAFSGTLSDSDGEWAFRGKYSGLSKKRRGANKIELGPGGRSLQELLAISSLQRGTNVGDTQQTPDLAQIEANRHFGRIMLGSAPKDVQDALYPNIIQLTADEVRVQEMGKEFFKRAAIHYLLSQIAQSADIKKELKREVNLRACERFLSVCGSLTEPVGIEDPVKAYGWDRENDKAILTQLQGEYQRVVLECYKLGYLEVAVDFHPFLADAKYWYKRYTAYLLGDQHLTEFKNRIAILGETGASLYSLQTKLTLLKEAAQDDIDDAADVACILDQLRGVAFMSLLQTVPWNKDTTHEVVELFRSIDELEQHGNGGWREGTAYYDQQKLREERGATTWAAVVQTTIDGLETLRGNKTWSMMEASNILALATDDEALRQNPFKDREGDYIGIFPLDPELTRVQRAWKQTAIHIRAALVSVAAFQMISVLVDPESNRKLSTADKVSMWGSVVESLAHLKNTTPGAAIITRALDIGARCMGLISKAGRAIGIALQAISPQWLVDLVRGAANWSAATARATVRWVRGLPMNWDALARYAMKVFGFAVSLAALVAAIFDVKRVFEGNARLRYKILATTQLVIAGFEVLCLAAHGIGWMLGAAGFCSACAIFAPALVVAGLVLAVVAFGFEIFDKEEDPIEKFIHTYGRDYRLLVGMKP